MRVPIYIEDHEQKPDTFSAVSGGAKVFKSLQNYGEYLQHTYFNNSEQCFFICPHDRESFLTTSSKHTFNTSNTHAIYNISCQPKWNLQVEQKKVFYKGRTGSWYSQKFRNIKCDVPSHTRSGVLSIRPCSNATPRSMCTTSAVSWSMRIFTEWRSPRPTIYPTWIHGKY